jgi:hypothetical protein
MLSDDQDWMEERPESAPELAERPGSHPEWFALNLILGLTLAACVVALGIRAMFT